jgi:hypothetical protein
MSLHLLVYYVFSASQEIPSHFVEPEGSLPQSQDPVTLPCSEPKDQSRPMTVMNVS